MKKLLIILLLLLPIMARAEDMPLRWNASPSEGITGYNIYYKTGTPGPPYDVRIQVGNVTEFTVTNLDPNQAPYYVAGTAYNNYLESGYSGELVITKNNLASPEPMQSLEIAPRTFKEVTTTTTTSTTVRTVE